MTAVSQHCCPVLLAGVMNTASPREACSSNHWSWAALALAKVKNGEHLDELENFTCKTAAGLGESQSLSLH